MTEDLAKQKKGKRKEALRLAPRGRTLGAQAAILSYVRASHT